MRRFLPSFYIATTLVGTIVGAGFASGQEVIRFFANYGAGGMIGIIISTLLFILLGNTLLMLGYQKGFSNYLQFLNYLFGEKTARLFDLIFAVFLFCLTAVMASGAGSILYEHLHVSKLLGTALTVLSGYFVVKYQVKGITRVNALIVPLLVGFIFLIGISVVQWDMLGSGFSGTVYKNGWLLSALLYVSYNLVLSVGILLPLGKATKKSSSIFIGSLVGGLTLGTLLFLVYATLLSVPASFRSAEIPLLKSVQNFAFLGHYFFLIIFGVIFTTLIATSFSCLERIKFAIRQPVDSIFWFLVLIISQIGFGQLIGFLYPVFGAICLIVILKLFLKASKLNRL
ncbi:MAG: YkvI family membrane protein [Bacillota bacterium]